VIAERLERELPQFPWPRQLASAVSLAIVSASLPIGPIPAPMEFLTSSRNCAMAHPVDNQLHLHLEGKRVRVPPMSLIEMHSHAEITTGSAEFAGADRRF
jgi:hypothetical protein